MSPRAVLRVRTRSTDASTLSAKLVLDDDSARIAPIIGATVAGAAVRRTSPPASRNSVARSATGVDWTATAVPMSSEATTPAYAMVSRRSPPITWERTPPDGRGR